MEEKTKTIAEMMADLAAKYKLNDSAITEKLKTVPYHSFNYDNEEIIGNRYGTLKVSDATQKQIGEVIQKNIDYNNMYYNSEKSFNASYLSGAIRTAKKSDTCGTKAGEFLEHKIDKTFVYKPAPQYKYYVSKMLNGKPYSYGGVDSILRMDSEGGFSEINNFGKVSDYSVEDQETCHKQLKKGQLIEAAPALVNKILGIIDNGYYVPRKHPEGFGKGKSKYCVERSDSGWESVIISGRNPGINHPAGSGAAKECDEFVKSGEWILAEVEQVVEG